MRATSQRRENATELTRFIGTKVRELRKAQGMTQQDLAVLIGDTYPCLNRATLMRIEIGSRESVTVDELMAIAQALNVHFTELLPDPPEIPDSVRLRKMSQELRGMAVRSEQNDRLGAAWKDAR